MVCPKCGAQIKRFDLAPNCRSCGVHIMYYTQEADLAHDAKKCELEFAKGRKLVARIKKAYVQGKLPIARLVLMVICLVALLVPAGKVVIDAGFNTINITMGGLGYYQMFSGIGFDMLKNIWQCGIAKDALIAVGVELIMLVLTALAALGIFIAMLLTFTNLKKGTKAVMVLGGVYAAFGLASAIAGFVMVNSASGYTFIKASYGFGGWVYLLCGIAMVIINHMILKKDCDYSISDADIKRIEIAAKVKSGEINIDDLPLPVVEEEKEEAPAEKKKKKKKKAEKEAEK